MSSDSTSRASDPKTQKRALRREIVARILALDPANRRRQEAELARRFAALPGLDRATTVLLYVTAFPEEIDTRPIIGRVLGSGLRLVCPRVDRARRCLMLHHVRDLARDLVPGVLGIPEPAPTCPEIAPEAVDWALIPGLGFDRRCYRIGRGAGHYDRLLPTLRADAPRWALALDEQWVDCLPIEPHDQRLDGVVSPATVALREPVIEGGIPEIPD